jgi:hypothetical protein
MCLPRLSNPAFPPVKDKGDTSQPGVSCACPAPFYLPTDGETGTRLVHVRNRFKRLFFMHSFAAEMKITCATWRVKFFPPFFRKFPAKPASAPPGGRRRGKISRNRPEPRKFSQPDKNFFSKGVEGEKQRAYSLLMQSFYAQPVKAA